MYRENVPQNKQEKVYMNDEEVKRQFESWKRNQFTSYTKETHDEFLKDRYYKTNNFNTNDHFDHPGSSSGPSNSPPRYN